MRNSLRFYLGSFLLQTTTGSSLNWNLNMAQIPPLLGELHREIMGYIVLHDEPILDFLPPGATRRWNEPPGFFLINNFLAGHAYVVMRQNWWVFSSRKWFDKLLTPPPERRVTRAMRRARYVQQRFGRRAIQNLEVRLPLHAYLIWERKIGRFDAHPWEKFQNPDPNVNNGRLLTEILMAWRPMACITKPQQIRSRTGNLGKEISIRGPVQNRVARLPSSRFLREEFSRHVLNQSRY